jgi:hypothetical protein
METLLGQTGVMSFSEAAECSRARNYLGVTESGTDERGELFFINCFHTFSHSSWKTYMNRNMTAICIWNCTRRG